MVLSYRPVMAKGTINFRQSKIVLRSSNVAENISELLFLYNRQKHTNAANLRNMQSKRPKDYWRCTYCFKKANTTKYPTLQDFYEYFKNVNASTGTGSFDAEQAGFYDNDNYDRLDVLITEN